MQTERRPPLLCSSARILQLSLTQQKIFVPMTMYVSYKRDYAKFLNPAEEIHFLLFIQLLSVHLIFYMKKVNSDNYLRI